MVNSNYWLTVYWIIKIIMPNKLSPYLIQISLVYNLMSFFCYGTPQYVYLSCLLRPLFAATCPQIFLVLDDFDSFEE
jgi:uncharacterized membrane protein